MQGTPAGHSVYMTTLWTYEGRPVLGDPGAARLFCRVLGHLRRRLGFHLHAFVVLPDRVRLILSTPDGEPRSVQVVVHRLKSRFAREWNARRGRLGLVWQDADQMAVISGLDQLTRRAEMLHRSPVAAGLVRKPAHWVWSSVRPWSGSGQAPAAVDLPREDRPVAPWPRPAVSG